MTFDTETMRCMEIWGGNHACQKLLHASGIDIWIYSHPFADSQVGGDVFYFSSCASGRITRLLLADVSGHGSGVASTAKGLRDVIRNNVNVIKQASLVESINNQFGKLAESGTFATALVGTYFAPTNSLTISNAGHPPPFYFDHASKTWDLLTPAEEIQERYSDMPLGISGRTTYSQRKQTLGPGDCFLAFSDALPESVDHNGAPLGINGLLDLVRRLDMQDLNLAVPKLVERLRGLNPANLAGDDVTIVLGRPTHQRTPLKQSLLAPLKLLSPVKDRSQLIVTAT